MNLLGQIVLKLISVSSKVKSALLKKDGQILSKQMWILKENNFLIFDSVIVSPLSSYGTHGYVYLVYNYKFYEILVQIKYSNTSDML